MSYLDRTLNGDVSDWKTLIGCVGEIASGLSDLHKHGIIHRSDPLSTKTKIVPLINSGIFTKETFLSK